MIHQRTDIRDELKTILSGITYSGNPVPVFKMRKNALWKSELPAILIYGLSESNENNLSAPREYRRVYQIGIEVVAQDDIQTAGPGGDILSEDIIDSIFYDIETRLSENENLNDTAEDIILGDGSFGTDNNGEVPTLSFRQAYDVIYRTYLPRERTLEDFDQANIDYNLNDDGQVDAQDQINL